jgi:hypothetical protein
MRSLLSLFDLLGNINTTITQAKIKDLNYFIYVRRNIMIMLILFE